MAVTVKVNGTMNSLVHKGSNGVSIATIPDVCKTPSPGGPVPIPYPNISQTTTEYDAYKRTEQWLIDRGLPPHDPAFRRVGPGGKTIVNEAAIKASVDRNYPITPPATAGGPTPPQVVGRTADGKSVIVQDSAGKQTLRPPREGDTFPAAKPRNPPHEKQIPPDDFKCP